jgi:hypothetical protein
MNDNSEIKLDEIINIYNKKYNKESLIPFIGAGFSASIIPDWNSIIIELLEGFDLPENEKKDLSENPLDAFEYYIWKSIEKNNAMFKPNASREFKYSFGKMKLLDFIKDQVEVTIKKEGNDYFGYKNGKKVLLRNQKEICKKFKDVIYTTNWDSLIEDVGNFSSISLRKELIEGFNTEKHKKVIKFHGCAKKYELSNNDGLIASKTDYYERMSEFNLFDLIFKNDFIQNKFLFIGYSLRDTNVSLMIYQLMKLISDFSDNYKIIWAVSDFRQDSRVFANCSHALIRPYYLLTSEQEDTLLNKENKILERCEKCKYSTFIASGYDDFSLKFICTNNCSINADKVAIKIEKYGYIEDRIHYLLDNLK